VANGAQAASSDEPAIPRAPIPAARSRLRREKAEDNNGDDPVVSLLDFCSNVAFFVMDKSFE
jgi:hypothetical protein